MKKIFISTVPFGASGKSLEMLERSELEFTVNPTGRKLTAEEVGEFCRDCDGLIAGLENISEVLKIAPQLKIISRAGVGLDSVPLSLCQRKGITVCYTPGAMTDAVAEYTVGLMIAGSRGIVRSDLDITLGKWVKYYGKRLGRSTVGLLGYGRIAQRVEQLLRPFGCKVIHCDIVSDQESSQVGGNKVELSELFETSDIISLHLPLYSKTRNMISKVLLGKMKDGAIIINTSRGGIVDELALFDELLTGRISACLDVFEDEPYRGPLKELDNCILTAHMASCTYDCRAEIETQATEDVIRYFEGKEVLRRVPSTEILYQEFLMRDVKSLKKFKSRLPENISVDLPSVEGHTLTPLQWLTFQFYTETTTMAECCRRLQEIGFDVTPKMLSTWRRTDWWTSLLESNVEYFQENFYSKVFEDSHYLHEALVKIWRDKWPNDKTANAVVASLRELNRMGKGTVDPIAQNKRDYNIKITKEEKISIEVIERALPRMTEVEAMEFSRSGDLPKRLVDDIITIDHEEVDE